MPFVRALCLLLCLLVVRTAGAEEIVVGRGTSTTRTSTDWKGYFNGDMRMLTTHAETTTEFAAAGNAPVTVNGVTFDLPATSPIRTTSVARNIARPQDPEFGTVQVESNTVDAKGHEIRASFVLRDKNLMTPITVGPMEGASIRPPAREEVVDGKKFAISSSTRTVQVSAIIVAPTFDDLLASRNLRDVSEAGTQIEKGTIRVLSPKGEPIGFYAGDVRRADVVQFVEAR